LRECLGRQTHRASRHLAILHLPRVEDRIVALFADLAERFGRMTPDGIVIDLPLTHQVIGDLVASRRPTISIALQTLAADGVVQRLDDGRWHLAAHAVPP
jgi:CRP-like cAMP-binding protein